MSHPHHAYLAIRDEHHELTDNEGTHLHAFNAAFYELGLGWHWDEVLFRDLRVHASEKEQLTAYLRAHQPHLLTVYDPDFLADVIHAVKTRYFAVMKKSNSPTGPGVDWATVQRFRRDI